MYYTVAAKYRAHFCRRQHPHQRQVTADGADLRAPASGAVERRQHERGLSGADGLAYLLKPGDGKTGPAGKTDCVAAALRKQRFDAICQPRRYANRPSRRPHEALCRHCALDYIAAGRQPQTPAGKIGGHVGDEFAAGAHDKAQQTGTVADRTGSDAAALWPRRRLHFVLPSACLSAGNVSATARRAHPRARV